MLKVMELACIVGFGKSKYVTDIINRLFEICPQNKKVCFVAPNNVLIDQFNRIVVPNLLDVNKIVTATPHSFHNGEYDDVVIVVTDELNKQQIERLTLIERDTPVTYIWVEITTVGNQE